MQVGVAQMPRMSIRPARGCVRIGAGGMSVRRRDAALCAGLATGTGTGLAATASGGAGAGVGFATGAATVGTMGTAGARGAAGAGDATTGGA